MAEVRVVTTHLLVAYVVASFTAKIKQDLSSLQITIVNFKVSHHDFTGSLWRLSCFHDH